jgi:cytochrome b
MPPDLVAIRVWDLPVRIFHWALLLVFAFQVASGYIGGDAMAWHVYSGYCMLVLVVFRILWGFAGSTHARFASFLAGPVATLHFAKRLFSREAVPQVGHNPLGGWMVVALVAALALQAASGLFANDGIATEGPLMALVSVETATLISQFHRGNVKLLIVLSCLHVAGVLFHWLVKKDDLVGAMFTGVKRVPESLLHERREARRGTALRRAASREIGAAHFASHWRAAAVLAAAVAIVVVVVRAP